MGDKRFKIYFADNLTIRSSRDRFAARLTRYRVPPRQAATRSGLTQVLGAMEIAQDPVSDRATLSASQRFWRLLAASIAAALLLSPSILTALVWTPVNLFIAFATLLVATAFAIWLPRAKLPIATIGSLLIGVPPYPNWLWYSEGGLIVRLGASLTRESPLRFLWLVLPAFALLLVLQSVISTLARPRAN